jgi:hypothetical protein
VPDHCANDYSAPPPLKRTHFRANGAQGLRLLPTSYLGGKSGLVCSRNTLNMLRWTTTFRQLHVVHFPVGSSNSQRLFGPKWSQRQSSVSAMPLRRAPELIIRSGYDRGDLPWRRITCRPRAGRMGRAIFIGSVGSNIAHITLPDSLKINCEGTEPRQSYPSAERVLINPAC